MDAHHYHPVTGLYLGASPAQPDPVELERARRTLLASLNAEAHAAYAQGLRDGLSIEAVETVFLAALDAAGMAAEALEPEHWLIPANAVAEAPPEADEGKQVRRVDDAWVVEDIPEPEPEPTPPEPTEAELAVAARRRRDGEIAALRWMVERHGDQLALDRPTTLSPDAYVQLLEHIEGLRNVPEQAGFPLEIVWPVLPLQIQQAAG